MADQAETSVHTHLSVSGVGWGVYTASVTTNDTVTFGDFTELFAVCVVKLDNNSTCTATISITTLNMITVTQATLVADKVLIYVYGL